MSETAWFESFFGEGYFEIYADAFWELRAPARGGTSAECHSLPRACACCKQLGVL